jgi:hypothetical protein
VLSALKLASSPGGRKRPWLPWQFGSPPEVRIVIGGIHNTSHRRIANWMRIAHSEPFFILVIHHKTHKCGSRWLPHKNPTHKTALCGKTAARLLHGLVSA